jgi:hypothetical protein
VRIGQNREDRADRHVDVDVARAVERVVADEVGAAVRGARGHAVIHFLGSAGRDHARAEHGLGDDFVADDVELFLLFALHVFAAGRAQNAHEGAAGHFGADFHAAGGDRFDQRSELGVKTVGLDFVREHFAQGDLLHKTIPYCR